MIEGKKVINVAFVYEFAIFFQYGVILSTKIFSVKYKSPRKPDIERENDKYTREKNLSDPALKLLSCICISDEQK
jgi:hypothetical protein